jgi:hypothetical protein
MHLVIRHRNPAIPWRHMKAPLVIPAELRSPFQPVARGEAGAQISESLAGDNRLNYCVALDDDRASPASPWNRQQTALMDQILRMLQCHPQAAWGIVISALDRHAGDTLCSRFADQARLVSTRFLRMFAFGGNVVI